MNWENNLRTADPEVQNDTALSLAPAARRSARVNSTWPALARFAMI